MFPLGFPDELKLSEQHRPWAFVKALEAPGRLQPPLCEDARARLWEGP